MLGIKLPLPTNRIHILPKNRVLFRHRFFAHLKPYSALMSYILTSSKCQKTIKSTIKTNFNKDIDKIKQIDYNKITEILHND